jgi:hypothetical protein
LSRARRATGFLCYGLAPPMSDAGGGGVYGWARFPSDAGGRVLNLQALQGCCGRRCLSIHPRWSVGSNQKLSSTPMHHPKPPYVPHVRGSQVARLVWHLHHLHPSAGELANDAVIGGGEVVGVRAVACGGWREAVLVEGFSKGPTRQSSLYTKASFPKRPQKTSCHTRILRRRQRIPSVYLASQL